MQTTTNTELKTKLGPGPWATEPDHATWKTKAGLHAIIHRVPHHGALCGYVAVPPGHPHHKVHYDEVPVDVHGGLTYAKECAGEICHVAEPGEPEDVWWLGFDCAHSDDLAPISNLFFSRLAFQGHSYNEEYRDFEYVKAQCEKLAEQLAGMSLKEDARVQHG